MEERTEPSEVVTRLAVYRLEPNGFIRKTTNPGAEYTLREAQEDLDAFIKLSPDVRRPLLADERELRAADYETRSFWSGKDMLKYVKAVAVITGNSAITNMIGNFVITIARTALPTKLFTNEPDAVKWLEWFLDDDHDSPPPSRRFFGIELPPPSKRSPPQDVAPSSKRWFQQDAAPASKRWFQKDTAPSSKRSPPQDAAPSSKGSPPQDSAPSSKRSAAQDAAPSTKRPAQ